jgi:hypothetical protein
MSLSDFFNGVIMMCESNYGMAVELVLCAGNFHLNHRSIKKSNGNALDQQSAISNCFSLPPNRQRLKTMEEGSDMGS